MRIAIIGRHGQLTRALTAGKPVGAVTVVFGRPQIDLAATKPDFSEIQRFVPNIVINAAAYTQVDKAEAEPDAAFAVNHLGVAALAEFCTRYAIPLIHISTDYVFDGEKAEGYAEDDRPNPLNVYGASKLAGEDAVRSIAPQHLILRTSWVFSATGQNFVKTMLRLAQAHPVIRVVGDQRGRPTAAASLASAIWRIIERLQETGTGGFPWGTYHCAGAPAVSWAEFAEAIFAEEATFLSSVPHIEWITSCEFPSAARRPSNSVLDCNKLQRVFGLPPLPWRPALRTVLNHISHEEYA